MRLRMGRLIRWLSASSVASPHVGARCARRSPRRPRCRDVAGRCEVEMASTTDSDRVLLGRLGAYTVHNQYDSRELTKPARMAFESKFERDVDPDGVLPLEE